MEYANDNLASSGCTGLACVLLLSLPLLAWGCGSDDETSLRHYGDEITVAAGALEVSVEDHYAAMHNATGIDEMHDLEAHHSQEALSFMGSMLDADYSLQTCGRHMRISMHAPLLAELDGPRQAMHASMNAMEAEVEHHADAIWDLQDVGAVADEEDRHHTAMLDLLDQFSVHSDDMLAAMDSMEREGVSMMCSMDTHMHHSW